MQIHGPYSDDTWQWVPDAWKETDAAAKQKNRPAGVVWEIGLVLAIPLASAGIVGLFLKTAGIY
jgi:hypothetical protein